MPIINNRPVNLVEGNQFGRLVEKIKKCSTGGKREKGNILTCMTVKFPIINICPIKFQPSKRPLIWKISLYKFKYVGKQCFAFLPKKCVGMELCNQAVST